MKHHLNIHEEVAQAFEAGWAGVFYKTICKQEIREVSPRFDAIKEGSSFAGFRNMEQLSENPYEVDFDILRRLKQRYPTKIVVASIMGEYEEEWIELAKMAEAAGCDGNGSKNQEIDDLAFIPQWSSHPPDAWHRRTYP